jgi:DNA-binding NarL/FixJ family response regulator
LITAATCLECGGQSCGDLRSVGDLPMRTAVVLDPHPLWLDAIARVLKESGFDVVGTTTETAKAVELVAAHAPDLLLAEISRDGGDAFRVIREAHERAPATRVLVLAASDDPDLVRGALAAGAVAYVVKTSDPEDVAFAVRHTFEPSIFLAGQASAVSPAPDLRENDAVRQLTKRELEILRLVAEGESNVQLARRLWVTEQTVKFHLSNIYRKLGVSNRTEASRWAQVHGLLEPRSGGAE